VPDILELWRNTKEQSMPHIHSLIGIVTAYFFSLRTMNCKDNNGQAILKLMWLFPQVFFQKFYIISHISINNHKTPYWQILLKSG
jgi:hypothetical protein